jgi:hypothetical protein
MRAVQFILTEGEIDELASDVADIVFNKKFQNVQKMDFDEFLSDLVQRGHTEISAQLLRDMLEELPIIQNVSSDTIEFTGNMPDDMDQDGIEDMGAKVSSMADQEAMKGIKAEL